MKMIHRYLGQWLDKNWDRDTDEVLAEATDPFFSTIASLLEQKDILDAFESTVKSGRYVYALPYEVGLEQVNPNYYYRFEVKESKMLDAVTISYAKGEILETLDDLNFMDKAVRLAEYRDVQWCLEDLTEDCHLLAKDRWKKVQIINSVFNVDILSWRDGKAYTTYGTLDTRIPVTEQSFEDPLINQL